MANLKFYHQIPHRFGDVAENVKLPSIPINNFLCTFITASSPGLHTFFCLCRVRKKLPRDEIARNTFQRSRSISWKWNMHIVKCANPFQIKRVVNMLHFHLQPKFIQRKGTQRAWFYRGLFNLECVLVYCVSPCNLVMWYEHESNGTFCYFFQYIPFRGS